MTRSLASALGLLALAITSGAASADDAEPRRRPREREARETPGAPRDPDSPRVEAAHPPLAPRRGTATATAPLACDRAARADVGAATDLARWLDVLGAVDAADPGRWLEAWPEASVQALGDSPALRVESSHAGWLTVLWSGPDGRVLVAVDALWLPQGGTWPLAVPATLVQPAGREEVVALLTPDPHPLPCGARTAGAAKPDGAAPKAMAAWVAQLARGPVAVARTALTSAPLAAARGKPLVGGQLSRAARAGGGRPVGADGAGVKPGDGALAPAWRAPSAVLPSRAWTGSEAPEGQDHDG